MVVGDAANKYEIQADSKHSMFSGRKTLAAFFQGGVHWVHADVYAARQPHCGKVRSSGIPRAAAERADNDQNEMKESVCSSF